MQTTFMFLITFTTNVIKLLIFQLKSKLYCPSVIAKSNFAYKTL